GLESPAGPEVTAADAEAFAREDLLTAEPGVTIAGAPRTELWLWPGANGRLARTWIVRQATRDPWGSVVTRIDASTGAVLSREDGAQRRQRTGEVIVYRTNADYPNRPRAEKIPGLVSVDQDPEGHLEGVRFRVLDEKGDRVASTKLRYLY